MIHDSMLVVVAQQNHDVMPTGPRPPGSRFFSGILMAITFLSLVWWYNAILLSEPVQGFGTVKECALLFPPTAHYFGGDGLVDLYCITFPDAPQCYKATFLNAICSCLDPVSSNTSLLEVSAGSKNCVQRRSSARVYSSKYPQYLLVFGTVISTAYVLYMRIKGTALTVCSLLVIFLTSALPLLSLLLALQDFSRSSKLDELILSSDSTSTDIDSVRTENVLLMGAAVLAVYEVVYIFFIFSWSDFRDNPYSEGPLESEAWRWHTIDCSSGVAYVTVALAHVAAFDAALQRFLQDLGWGRASFYVWIACIGILVLIFAIGLCQGKWPGSATRRFSLVRIGFTISTKCIIAPITLGIAVYSTEWFVAAAVVSVELSAICSAIVDYVGLGD